MKLSGRVFGLLALGVLCLVECAPLSSPRRHIDTSSIDVNRVLKILQAGGPPKLEPRSITAFVTDPALLVTILHSLEIAYWTMPFGFILSPIINLFRMPNRRMDDHHLSGPIGRSDNVRNKQFYRTLAKAIANIEKLNGKSRRVKSFNKR